jgi:hypothetical protein
MTQHDNELYLIMGRLEGKVDALTSMLTTTAQRLETLEMRLAKAEAEIAAIKGEGTTAKTWFSNIIAIAAALIAAAAIYLESFNV